MGFFVAILVDTSTMVMWWSVVISVVSVEAVVVLLAASGYKSMLRILITTHCRLHFAGKYDFIHGTPCRYQHTSSKNYPHFPRVLLPKFQARFKGSPTKR